MLRRLVRIQLGLAVALLLAFLELKTSKESKKASAIKTWTPEVKVTAGDEIVVRTTETVEWNVATVVKSMTVEGKGGLTGTSELQIETSLTAGSETNLTGYTGIINLKGTGTLSASTLAAEVHFGTASVIKLLTALKTSVKLKTEGKAKVETQGHEVEATNWENSSGEATVNIENSTVKLIGGTFGTGWTMAEGNTFTGTGSTFELVTVTEEHNFEGGGKTYGALISGNFWVLKGNNSFTSWAINTKEAAEGHGLRLANGSVQSVSGAITTNGTAAKKGRVESDKAGTQASIKGSGSNKKTTGTLIVKDIKYTGGGTWYIEGEGSEGTNTENIVFGPEPGGVKENKMTASLSFTGNLERRMTHQLVAALTFNGALGRATTRAMAAVLSFTGVLQRSTVRALVAALSFTGALQRTTTRALAASLTFTGQLGRKTVRSFAATLSPAVSFSAALAGQFVRHFAAALTFEGALNRGTTRKMPAALTPAGELQRTMSRRMPASLSFNGQLGRTITKPFTASLSFAGQLGRNIATRFRATLGLIGRLTTGGGKEPEPGTVTLMATPVSSVTLTAEALGTVTLSAVLVSTVDLQAEALNPG